MATKTFAFGPGEVEEPFAIALHFEGGRSDKMYNLAIDAEGGGWSLRYANGRRGDAMVFKPKETASDRYADVAKECREVLASKVAKGYRPVSGTRLDGTAVDAPVTTRDMTDLAPQLLNPIEEEDLERYLDDDGWLAQEKHDGERRMAMVLGGVATGANRQGESVGLPRAVAEGLLRVGRDIRLDAEIVGDRLYVFDVLALAPRDGGPLVDVTGESVERRLGILAGVEGLAGPAVRLELGALGRPAKRALEERVRASLGEGLVFKRLGSPYVPGKPNSGGDALKAKFYRTLTAIVTKGNTRRSVALGLVDEAGEIIGIGNVSVPTNHDLPDVGAMVEVRYLYAYEGGSLYQPTYLGRRTDVIRSDCRADQRIFKAPVERRIAA